MHNLCLDSSSHPWNFRRPPLESLTTGKMLGRLGTGTGDKQNCIFPKGMTQGFFSRSCLQFASFLENGILVDVLELPAFFFKLQILNFRR
mmetsp:Transcript_2956/g.6365  ORF Transcript_2956/g.6365 Transcript_2956/m.6365 type:complete len:90 (-) Transcript_2956:148-417(-)